ncbi:Prolyl endopeptidase [Strongyloides ratti]|uniref:Prolyl endopeptidase n=1 Tax=Strongyloides ratti TaxID=34506 RepID=A0A090KXG3_STRRB|nr:Prolyl endopeptidase [Strongyloides ratti]CEF59953.2 Prolyl endopeptidase [Strongyloides ratti]
MKIEYDGNTHKFPREENDEKKEFDSTCDQENMFMLILKFEQEFNLFTLKLNYMFGKFMNNSKFITPVKNILLGYNKYTIKDIFWEYGDYQYYFQYNNKKYRSVLKRKNIYNNDEQDFINLDNYDNMNMSSILSFAFSHTKKIIGYEILKFPDILKLKFKYVNGTELNDELIVNSITEYAFVLNDTGFIYSKYPFYTFLNRTMHTERRNHSLYFHRFGTKQENDIRIVPTGLDENTVLRAKVSNNGNYLLVKSHNTLNDTTALFFYNLQRVTNFSTIIILSKLIGNYDAYYDFYDSFESNVILFTNNKSYNGRILIAQLPKFFESIQTPQVFIKEEKDLYIKNIIPVGKEYLVLICYKNALFFLQIYNKYTKILLKEIDLGAGVIENGQGDTSSYNFYFLFNNIYIPKAIYKINLKGYQKGDITVKIMFQSKFSTLNTKNFIIKREYYNGKNGKKIPMILFHNKDLKKNQKNPVIVEAYGDFTAAWHPQNSLAKMFFVKEFGGIWCIPGIRGIEGLGEKWTSDGRKLKRKNSFEDFIYGIYHLIKQKYTTSNKIAIYGEGEGGLLTTVVSQREPKLIGAVVAKSPLLDTIRYDKLTEVKDFLINLYGELNNKEDFLNLYSFSPYHQLKDKNYCVNKLPSTLIIHPLFDSVYGVQHTIKYLAKLYEFFKKNKKSCQTNLVLASLMKHGGSFDKNKNGYHQMEELYRMLLFLQQVLDLKFEK